jgi:hypothetical protein
MIACGYNQPHSEVSKMGRKVKNKPETWFVWNIFSIFAL